MAVRIDDAVKKLPYLALDIASLSFEWIVSPDVMYLIEATTIAG